MRYLFKILLLVISLAVSASAVERSNTFFLLPSSIQQQIIIFENKKPINQRCTISLTVIIDIRKYDRRQKNVRLCNKHPGKQILQCNGF